MDDRLRERSQHRRRHRGRTRRQELLLAVSRSEPSEAPRGHERGRWRQRCVRNVIACWNVGLFDPRIVCVRIPGAKRIRSAVASERHAPRVGALRRLELCGRLVDAPSTAMPRRRRHRLRRRTSCRTGRRPSGRAAIAGPSARRTTSRCRRSSRRGRAAGRCRRASRAGYGAPRPGPARARRSRACPTRRRARRAPAESTLPSRSASRRLPPAAYHASTRATAPTARGVPVPRESTSRMTGQTRISRRSWVAAPFIAATTRRERVLLPTLDPRPEQIDALHRPPRPLVVRARVPAGRLVVPVEDHAGSSG